jgi:hypothetical protein
MAVLQALCRINHEMGETNAREDIQVVTGSDAFILNNLPRRSRSRVPRGTLTDKLVNIPNPSGKEFRLTITIAFQEYRQPSQQAGSLWLEYHLGTTTASLPMIEAVVPVENPSPKNNYFTIVTMAKSSFTTQGRPVCMFG